MRAQVNRGEIYAHSMGVNQDYQQAKYWYEKAAT
ncbi:SEL1-like repeat protein [Salmonella enterica]|nr:SEL1-like repeat protein [Salmonella enterica]